MQITYPGESPDYRIARAQLVQAEVDLRAQIAKVAAQRRALPEGGAPPQDYEFAALDGSTTTLSSLFGSRPTLAIYSLMYSDDADAACPMCVSMLDGLNGQAAHIGQRVSLVVVASASTDKLIDLAGTRGWSGLNILSAGSNSYQTDYHGQGSDGAQVPMMNVFKETPNGIRHFWGSEGFFAPLDGQPRHIDALWPLWNMLDLTPEGRGEDWYPALNY